MTKDGHHDDVFPDVAAQTGDGRRNDAETASGEVILSVVGEFAADLVVKMHGGRSVGANGHREIFLQAEREQDGFLGPLVDDPFPVFLFRHSQLAAVELPDDFGNGGAEDGGSITCRETVAVFPGVFDDLFELFFPVFYGIPLVLFRYFRGVGSV